MELAPQAEDFLKQVEDVEQLKQATYYDVWMSSWNDGKVAVLGGAAHALSPQLGQGVNLALIDAASVASCLEKCPVVDALACYNSKRR